MAWIPSMREKYPKSLVDGPCDITPTEQVGLGSCVLVPTLLGNLEKSPDFSVMEFYKYPVESGNSATL